MPNILLFIAFSIELSEFLSVGPPFSPVDPVERAVSRNSRAFQGNLSWSGDAVDSEGAVQPCFVVFCVRLQFHCNLWVNEGEEFTAKSLLPLHAKEVAATEELLHDLGIDGGPGLLRCQHLEFEGRPIECVELCFPVRKEAVVKGVDKDGPFGRQQQGFELLSPILAALGLDVVENGLGLVRAQPIEKKPARLLHLCVDVIHVGFHVRIVHAAHKSRRWVRTAPRRLGGRLVLRFDVERLQEGAVRAERRRHGVPKFIALLLHHRIGAEMMDEQNIWKE